MGLELAIWQGAGVPGDLDATLAEVARVAGEAARAGADLLVFPEGFLTGYHIPGLAPGGLPGVEAALEQAGRIAAETELAMVLGTHLDTPRGLRNSAVVFDALGAEIGRYHKRTLFGAWEKATFLPGDAPLRFDCGGLRVGVAICYDVEFPELIRAEAQAGVELVVVPTALMTPHERVAEAMVAARALENQIFVAYCNRSGREPELEFVGLSSIRDPRGAALAQAGAGPELLLAGIDGALIARERAANSYLDDLGRFL
ncbi:carbon-nitrogen hydrolase family protein [Oceaniglobus roseus]|uniref:carbon-nitrogen hydrolase family protein n=1 Tax=Oceaniglobus roseus TaxID=1737570 RepID=UPI000C7ECE82|nr:carbon-nitrogen hydrolase family protein [Kandeliimicrobium roseum]